MKTKYKYIHFTKADQRAVPDTWFCRNNRTNDILGVVHIFPRWRQYTLVPSPQTVFSADCLDDISHFLKQLNSEQK